MQNYFKSTPKNLQNTLFLNTPKWLLISGPSHLAHAKKRKWYQDIWRLKTGLKPKNLAVFPKINNQRWPKSLQKSIIFIHPKSTQIFIDHQKLGARKNH
jgi:hypothetical protein